MWLQPPALLSLYPVGVLTTMEWGVQAPRWGSRGTWFIGGMSICCFEGSFNIRRTNSKT